MQCFIKQIASILRVNSAIHRRQGLPLVSQVSHAFDAIGDNAEEAFNWEPSGQYIPSRLRGTPRCRINLKAGKCPAKLRIGEIKVVAAKMLPNQRQLSM